MPRPARRIGTTVKPLKAMTLASLEGRINIDLRDLEITRRLKGKQGRQFVQGRRKSSVGVSLFRNIVTFVLTSG